MSEIAHLWPSAFHLIPSALFRTALKLGGYHAGRMESRINLGLKQRLSMHRFFWAEFEEADGVRPADI